MKRLWLISIFVIACNIVTFGQGLKIFNDLQDLIIAVSEEVRPTVVHIEVVKKYDTSRFESLGSGLIISPDGFIITNEHVVDKYVSVTVTLESKLEYPAEVVGVGLYHRMAGFCDRMADVGPRLFEVLACISLDDAWIAIRGDLLCGGTREMEVRDPLCHSLERLCRRCALLHHAVEHAVSGQAFHLHSVLYGFPGAFHNEPVSMSYDWNDTKVSVCAEPPVKFYLFVAEGKSCVKS